MTDIFRARALRGIRSGSGRMWVSTCDWLIHVPRQLGIVTRLAVALAGVTVLMVAADLIAEHGLIIATLMSAPGMRQSAGDVPGPLK